MKASTPENNIKQPKTASEVTQKYALRHTVKTQEEYEAAGRDIVLNRAVELNNLYVVYITTVVMETKPDVFEWQFIGSVRTKKNQTVIPLSFLGNKYKRKIEEFLLVSAGKAGILPTETERFTQYSHVIRLRRPLTEAETKQVLIARGTRQ